MSISKPHGFLVGLFVALLAAVLAAGFAEAPPPARLAGNPTEATPIEAAATLPATATPLPTRTAFPTPSPSPALPTAPPPSASPTVTQPPAPTSPPTQSPTASTEQVIGHSVEGRPIFAYRVGHGPIKIALIGDIHGQFEANTHLLAQQLLEHFLDHPDQVPPNASLWIIPTINPDGLATDHRWNANGVDLNRNADTDLDGCAGNDWSHDTFVLEGPQPGGGGAYPFSEPESRAIRDFLQDAWIAVFYHSAAKAIFLDTCQRHLPTARLADAISAGTGYPVPEEGWSGYPVTGDFGDYLAGEGVAAVVVELTDHEDPEFERNLQGVQAMLAALDDIMGAEAFDVGAEYVWLDESNTGIWHYAENTFIHPIALAVLEDTAYLLDRGRILALPLTQPEPPETILSSGDYVEDVRVLEPLDLATDGASLLVLDRAGDVYHLSPPDSTWTVERYDRPVRDTYDHYFVSLDVGPAANYLLETTHEQVWRFVKGEMGAAWLKLPQSRDVDIGIGSGGVYVLTRAMNSPIGNLFRYQDAKRTSGFQPNVDLMHPRQVVATDPAVYVLDRAGRRLLALEPQGGRLLALHQFADRRHVSAIWSDPLGQQVILAGRDTVYFYEQPQRQATIDGGPVEAAPQPHDPTLLQALRGLSVPLLGTTVTTRDFQMPGAPRHYRLGVHEGIDFYGSTVGVPVDNRTPVRSVADGTVIRALVDYQPLTAAQADAWSAQSLSLGYTPPEVLDGYRGMQVWIDHGDGLVSRYAHLSSIEPGIAEGATVTQGQVIATVGNSGTPSSLRSETYDVHLHLELWVGDHFVGQFLRPIEAREWLEKILR